MSLLKRLPKIQNYFQYMKYQNYSVKAKRKSSAEKRAEVHDAGEQFPVAYFNKKMKTPENLYLAKEETANILDKLIGPYLKHIKCDTVLEFNPGAGFFTKKLLDREEQFRKIILVEHADYFMPKLNEFHSLYPERVEAKHGDFVGLWKLCYQDKLDKGHRVADLLDDVVKGAVKREEGSSTVICGAVGSYNFFKQLINAIIFQNSINTIGHYEMFLVVPPPIYIHLTCSNDVGYMIYRSTSMLFQILFEYRFIARIPRNDFLPIEVQYNPSRCSKLTRIKSVNPDYLYLVQIAPRRNVSELCSIVDLPALWYFVKQNCVSRKNRIIPNLEKYVNGSGPRLIINKNKRKPVKKLFKDEDASKLPKFSKQCTTMSNQDFYPNMNIYTEFGDLSPSQMLTLFTEFRKWPEYGESSFLASLENSLLKLETSAEDESIDGIGLQEEDDVTGNELLEGVSTDSNTVEKPKKKTSTKTKKSEKA